MGKQQHGRQPVAEHSCPSILAWSHKEGLTFPLTLYQQRPEKRGWVYKTEYDCYLPHLFAAKAALPTPVWPFLAHPIPSLNPHPLLHTPPHLLAPCVWVTAVHGYRVCPVEGIARERTVPAWNLGVVVNRDCKLNRI